MSWHLQHQLPALQMMLTSDLHSDEVCIAGCPVGHASSQHLCSPTAIVAVSITLKISAWQQGMFICRSMLLDESDCCCTLLTIITCCQLPIVQNIMPCSTRHLRQSCSSCRITAAICNSLNAFSGCIRRRMQCIVWS